MLLCVFLQPQVKFCRVLRRSISWVLPGQLLELVGYNLIWRHLSCCSLSVQSIKSLLVNEEKCALELFARVGGKPTCPG